MRKNIGDALILISLTVLYLAVTPFAKSISTENLTTIKADGSIDPFTAPIQRNGNTFALTGDIDGYIILSRNNTILDGAGHSVQGIIGPFSTYSNITYSWQTSIHIDVAILNFFVNGGYMGFDELINSTVANNTLNNCQGGGLSFGGKGTIISGNNITNCNYAGIGLRGSNNTIAGNYITGTNGTGIDLSSDSHNNTIFGNQIANNKEGISTFQSPAQRGAYDNLIYYNNFINNTKNVNNAVLITPDVAVNIWENGAIGNYWSDYNGSDANQDGIGDIPYVIDGSNQDRYPLMSPIKVSATLPNPLTFPYPTPAPSQSPSPSTTVSPTPFPSQIQSPKPSSSPLETLPPIQSSTPALEQTPFPSPSPSVSEQPTSSPEPQSTTFQTELVYAAAASTAAIAAIITAVVVLRRRKQ